MNEIQENKILQLLVRQMKYDAKMGLRNLLLKSSLDIKNMMVNILELQEDNPTLVNEGKKFVKDSTEVIISELEKNVESFLNQYIDDNL